MCCIYTLISTCRKGGATLRSLGARGPSSIIRPPERKFLVDNLLVRIQDDFSRPTMHHGSLNSLFQVALYLPS